MKTRMLSDRPTDIASAAGVLRAGGLVAFPTETVYGLGADAGNGIAVAGIYAAKGRPSFNPLIVHVPDVAAARALVHWSDTAERLTQRFWPGALTLVLPIRDDAPISGLVTAGLSTLAIRIPAARLARELLAAAGVPVAAPSANLSGQISPTRAAHVMGLSGRIDAILDGGACPVGLESTILGLVDAPRMLRPGGVPMEAIEQTLGAPLQHGTCDDPITAPGQLASHYAPMAAMRLNATTFYDGEARLGFGPVDCDLNLSVDCDLTEAAANLFDHLHQLDALDRARIAVSPVPMTGLGAAINDRLARAAAPRPERTPPRSAS